MKKLLLIISLLPLCAPLPGRAVEEEGDDETKDGKPKYALILPEEKAPELVKANEPCPYGGLVDEKAKETASGEEAKVSDMLRSLPVVGKSSRNCVLLGDIILRRGQIVPDIIPNQTVKLRVEDITPDHVQLTWVEKKPTGLTPRTLTIATDVSPEVKQRLPGNLGAASKGGGASAPVTSFRPRGGPEDGAKAAPRAQAVAEETPPSAASEPAKPASAGSGLLNLFFGNQVKEPAKSGPQKAAADEQK
ncbi:MAG: hypothetical protein K1X78_21020 [Verrucomicrobiaceae bacterium]|nr:hypothetical protein [Verrucomicrobiaceae bacterium]